MPTGAHPPALSEALGECFSALGGMAQGGSTSGPFKLLLCVLALSITQSLPLQRHTAGGLGRVSQHPDPLLSELSSELTLGQAQSRALLQEEHEVVDRMLQEITIRSLTTDIPSGEYRMVRSVADIKLVQDAAQPDDRFIVIARSVRFLVCHVPSSERYFGQAAGCATVH